MKILPNGKIFLTLELKNYTITMKGVAMKINEVADIGRIIRKTRKSQKITQADLAIASQVGIRFIVELENGKETAQLGKVLRVCRMLGITINVE